MRCPFCRENEDKVIDSRESADGFVIRRRRECERCERRFTTRERIEETPLRVIKHDGSREDFERRKILMGLLTACQKRAVSTEDLELIVQRVEERINDTAEREIETEAIGDLVMRELKRLDKVAYVRFASVYKNFESPQDFEQIAQQVAKPARRRAKKAAARKQPAAGGGETGHGSGSTGAGSTGAGSTGAGSTGGRASK